MSTRSFGRLAYVAAWSAPVLVVAFLAGSPRPMGARTEDAATDGSVSLATEFAFRALPINQDPSVPAASSVDFPVIDGGDSAFATF